MKAVQRCLLLVTFVSSFATVVWSKSVPDPARFNLSVELRDGTRIIGRDEDEFFKFRSAILGEIKLPPTKIRTAESLTETNSVRLTTTNGDELTVQYAMNEIVLESAFGTVKLPVNLIKSFHVSGLGREDRPLEGLIGFWSGEDNAEDSVTKQFGVNRNVSFTEGVVGRAFSFAPNSFPYGTYTGIQVADRPAYVLTQAMTIEAWVRPRGDGYVILLRGDHRPGFDPYTLSMQDNDDLCFQLTDNANTTVRIDTTLPYGRWTHVAATYDGDAETVCLYTNGQLAVSAHTSIRPMGQLMSDLSPGLGIGNVNDGGNNFPFVGDLDEIGLYNRALSAAEIQGIYQAHADNADKTAPLQPARPPMNMKGRPNFNGSSSRLESR